MTTPRITCIVLAAASLMAGSAWAQSDSKPLNLKLPSSSTLPAASASSSAPAHASSSTVPGKYYGDTSGTTDAALAANDPQVADNCDDSTYNKTQVHGSVGMGVVSGSHMSGNYQTGTVNLTKAFGDCDHPTGGVSISISGGQGNFDHDRGRYGR